MSSTPPQPTPPDDAEPLDALEAVEALLIGAADGVEADAPAWLAQLGGALVVAVVDWPGLNGTQLAPLRAAAPWSEALDDGAWLLAAPADDGRVQALLGPLRTLQAAHPQLCAALVVADGALGATRPLGPAPELATGLYARARAAGRDGVFLNATALAASGRLATPFGHDYQLPRHTRPRRVPLAVGLALAAALVLGVGLASRQSPAVPDGAIYFTAQRAQVERAEGPLRRGDHVQIRVEGEAGHFVTLLLRDGRGAWSAPDPSLVNHPLTATTPWVAPRFTLDDQPGTERFVALITAAPIPALAAVIDALPAEGTPEVAALRARLTPVIQGPLRVLATRGIEHGE